MNILDRLTKETRRFWATLVLAVKKFLQIDGLEWAGAFAFNAFFALFPLMLLFVSITSFIIDRELAGKEIVNYMERYFPLSGEMQRHVFDTLSDVIRVRGRTGVVAFLILTWGALQCFTTLTRAIMRAWDTSDYTWWRIPPKSLAMLGIATGTVLLSMLLSILMRVARSWLFSVTAVDSWVFAMGSVLFPLLVVFLSLTLFYKLAPRRPMQFAQVWAAALFATILLRAAEGLFVIYLKNFATLSAVYGAFGGIMALLLWIYVSGCIFIFGACLCSAQAEGHLSPADTRIAVTTKGIEL